MSAKPFVVFDHITPDYEGSLPDVKNDVRCYQTASTEVTGVCHHCGRFLSHASEAKPKFYQDHSLELTGILRGKEARAAHCKTHAHYLPYSPLKVLIVPGLILSIWGGFLLLTFISKAFGLGVLERSIRTFELLPPAEALASLWPLISATWAAALMPIFLFVIGLLLLVVGLNQYRIFYALSMSRPLAAIPLLGEFYKVLIKEDVKLDLELCSTTGPYVKNVSDIGDGDISLEIYLTGQEIEQLREAYRKKGEKYGFSARSEFDLGWLAIKSSPYAKFASSQQGIAMKKHIAPLKDLDIPDWYPAANYHYKISQEAIFTRGELPARMKRTLLWVRPILKELSGGHTLQLEFDVLNDPCHLQNWPYQRSNERVFACQFWEGLPKAKLQCVQVKVEKNPYSISTDAPMPIQESRGRVSKDRDKVQWQNIRLDNVLTGKTQEQDNNYLLRNTYLLTVTFSRPLTELKTPLEISFEILVDTASISGVDVNRDHFWFPNGRSTKSTKQDLYQFDIEYKSYLRGTLIVHPDVFAFQRETTASETIAKAAGIPLTSQVVTKLVRKLEEDKQIHIKSVVKSRPMIESENDLAYQKRNWNILGRFYGPNKHPIDVYILLVSRTPLVEGETTIWGNITYRCLQMNKGRNNKAADIPDQVNRTDDALDEMIKKECENVRKSLQSFLQLKDIPPDRQTSTPRILGQG